MSHIRSSGSAIEVALGRALWAAGFRYRKQYTIFGRPDFVLVKDRIAIFCDSEFWHGHGWGARRKAEHKTNQTYWFAKIERNRARDRSVNRRLRREGWTVIRFWERDIKRALQDCVDVVRATRSDQRTGRVNDGRSGNRTRFREIQTKQATRESSEPKRQKRVCRPSAV